MKVVSVIGQKGGSSKSTVALNLAVCAEQAGYSVAVIDTDPQGSAHKWFERREAETPSIVREIDPDALPRLIKIAASNKTDLLIVDTPGKAEATALAVSELADLILAPVKPTQFDLETLGAVKRTIRIAEKMDAGWVMLSQVPPSSKKVADEGEAAVQGYGLKLVPHKFMTRADFAYSMSSGLSATEFEPKGKAAEEARALFAWVRGTLNLADPSDRKLANA